MTIALAASVAAADVEVIRSSLPTDLVPSPVEFAVLAPAGYETLRDLPLILNLHGGGGSRENLIRQEALFAKLWSKGRLPAAIIATPSVTARGFYMNFKDGSELWEDFIVGPFIEHLRKAYPVSAYPKRTFVMGISMGGMGALRMAFRHPERFGAVAALEPGIEPVLRWEDIRPKHRFWRSDELFEQAFGKPVDPEYWADNNPATMVAADADRIRASGLQIYIDAADLDEFWLYEGAEFLHRTLWDHKIRHEYHLVRGASHIGSSIEPRFTEAAEFLIRSYKPYAKPPLRQRAVLKLIEAQQRNADAPDHYNDGVVQPD